MKIIFIKDIQGNYWFSYAEDISIRYTDINERRMIEGDTAGFFDDATKRLFPSNTK